MKRILSSLILSTSEESFSHLRGASLRDTLPSLRAKRSNLVQRLPRSLCSLAMTILLLAMTIFVILACPGSVFAANSGNFSLSLWVNPTTSVASKTLIGKAEEFRVFTNATGFAGCQTKTTSWQTAAQAITQTLVVGTWSHIICTYDLVNLKVYVNGTLVATQALTSLPDDTANLLKIGQDDSSIGGYGFLSGSIDEFKFYNYALTSDDVKTEYNHGSSLALGALGTNSSYQSNASNQEYCIPGDLSACAAPVGRWNFEEGKDNTCVSGVNDVCDTSGSGNDGAWSGTGTHWTTGKIGKAGKFNGTDDSVATTNVFNFSTTNRVTREAWIKILGNGDADNSENSIMVAKDAWDYQKFYWNKSSLKLTVQTDWTGNTATVLAGNTSLKLNQWYHVATTYDGSNIIIYLNGVQDGIVAVVGTMRTATQPFTIGSLLSSIRFFNGSIDDVRIFNYARTPAQVAWDYNRGGPVGWWKFDECQGSVAHDSAGTNNGTITVATGNPIGTCTTASTFWGGTSGTGAGKRNSAPTFDGVDDYVDAGDPANGTLDPQEITVSTWIKTTQTSAGRIVWKWGGSASERSYLLSLGDITSGKIRFIAATGDGTVYTLLDSGISVNDGNWHHIVGTYDKTAGTIKLYIDGVLEQNGSLTGNIQNTSGSLTISLAGTPFNGSIDDVKIFNYALTPLQVKTEYNNGAVNFSPVTGSP